MLEKTILNELIKVTSKASVLYEPEDLLTYESDGFTIQKAPPDAVVFPENTEQVSQVVKILHDNKIKFVPRGAGTGLSGGCLPLGGGVIISMTRMNRILEVDTKNHTVVVEPGVVNQWITDEVSGEGFFFAPDPSSGQACTIGGNVAENAGGPHTMKYGVTVNNILGLEIVLPDGEVVDIGGFTEETNGLDLTGLFNGSEGTFGIITKIITKIVPLPEHYITFCTIFGSVFDGISSITDMFKAGITPAALEMIDNEFVKALNEAFEMDFPVDAEAILIIELDGPKAGMNVLKDRVIEICRKNNVKSIEAAEDPIRRAGLWKARKHAFGAVGRMSPFYYTQDGVVPRTKLPDVLKVINNVSQKYSIRVANAFHAGDGNLHPCLMYDERNEGELDRVRKATTEILKACVDLGGTISGEHGIGSEKNNYMPWIFSEDDLEQMAKIKMVFNPSGLMNPDKIFPTSKSCSEAKIPGRVGGC